VKKALLGICVLLVFCSITFWFGMKKGVATGEARSIALASLKLPCSELRCWREGDTSGLIRLIEGQLDCGIVAALTLRESHLLCKDDRQTIDDQLFNVLAFRQDDNGALRMKSLLQIETLKNSLDKALADMQASPTMRSRCAPAPKQ
jgi:hypothetical protein